jgi:energy-converting hydrogenase Eha subunit H
VTRAFALFLIVLNAFAALGAIAALLALQRPEPFTVAEFEQRLADRLERITTPEQMRASSADIARISASGHSVVRDAFAFCRQAAGFAVGVAAANVILMATGIWICAQRRRNI